MALILLFKLIFKSRVFSPGFKIEMIKTLINGSSLISRGSLIYGFLSISFNFPIWGSKDTGFVFISDSLYDTIGFWYTRDLKLLSVECGFINVFSLDSIIATYKTFDSLFIRQAEIDANEEENIKLYF